MPAIGLKIVETGHVYNGVASPPFYFKTVWRRLGIEVMSFWSSSVEIWSYSCLIKISSCWSLWSVLTFSFFRLMICLMFSIGERSGLQKDQFSTRTLLLRSHTVVIAAVCGLHCPAEIHICCSKTFIYIISAFIVPSKTCNLPILYSFMHPHTIRDAGFWTERW